MCFTSRTSGTHRLCGLLLALCFCLLSGCAAYPRLKLAELTATENPSMVSPVPFFPQTEYQCGPAALAGVLGTAGIAISPEMLSPEIYLPARRGSLQVELQAATRRSGLIPYIVANQPQALVAEIEAGRPVLVFQNLRTPLFPVWHYAVLVGIDPGSNRMYLNSGTRQNLKLGARKFRRTWDWAGRWAMVVLRPGEIPTGDDPLRYAESVAAFEAVSGAQAALPAWQAAVRNWPQDSRAHLALGNSAYSKGDLSSAVQHFRRGLEVEAQAPGLNNNLASVLGELGCPRAGEARLQSVLEDLDIDSLWLPVMETTRAELVSQPGTDPVRCVEYEQ